MNNSTLFVYERPEPTTDPPETRVAYKNALLERAEKLESMVGRLMEAQWFDPEDRVRVYNSIYNELKNSNKNITTPSLHTPVVCQHCNQDTGWTMEGMTHLYIADDLKCPHCGEVVVFIYKTTGL